MATAGRYAFGFLLGVLLVPAAVLAGVGTGGGPLVGWVTFFALLAGALTVKPLSAARIAGVVSGVVALVAAGLGMLLYVFSQGTLG